MHYGLTATIDLSKIAANYRILKKHAPKAEMAAAVKADGYGLGAKEISRTLYAEGCRSFYTALLEEALELRTLMPDVSINVLGGLAPGSERDAQAKNITPVQAQERLREPDEGYHVRPRHVAPCLLGRTGTSPEPRTAGALCRYRGVFSAGEKIVRQ
jgi:alanine racemase